MAGSKDVEALRELAGKYGVEFLDAVSDDMLDPQLVDRVPVEWARSNVLLPIRRKGEICVLTTDPSDMNGQEYLAILIGGDLQPVVADRDVILNAIQRCYYRKDDSAEDFLKDLSSVVTEQQPAAGRRSDLLEVSESAPVTQFVNLVLLEALKARASDIHFEPFESKLRVRYRIDGVLYEQTSPPKHMEAALVSRLKVMARLDIAEKRLPQDGMMRVHVGDREIDIRVSTVPVAEGERVVLRLLDRDSSVLSLTELGMSDQALAVFAGCLEESHGLIVVAGPTGSGKTTTLYAALQRIDRSRKNIMTIEDPIEYQLPSIGQIQVKPKIGLTFASGLRHILRQDPDVVLVGETRDLETAEIAIRASLTGHLVFTTLHTNDAPSSVVRLVDMGVEPYLVGASLRAVLGQRLVRVLCPKCRARQAVDARAAAALGARGARLEGKNAWNAAGCADCLDGYRGRVGLFELMTLDADMQEMVRTGTVNVGDLRAAAVRRGMATLLEDGIEKVLRGTTALSEVLMVLGRTGGWSGAA